MSDVEQFLKSKCAYYQQFDEENHVVTQLGKSIINNSKLYSCHYEVETYERKGKMFKKSLNSDKFKERQFLLDKGQLFYFKADRQSKSLTLTIIT